MAKVLAISKMEFTPEAKAVLSGIADVKQRIDALTLELQALRDLASGCDELLRISREDSEGEQ